MIFNACIGLSETPVSRFLADVPFWPAQVSKGAEMIGAYYFPETDRQYQNDLWSK